jgi:hypothetical protein
MRCLPQNPKVTADRAFNGFGTNFEGSPEPLYGSLFLPRKFKVPLLIFFGITCCTPLQPLHACSAPACALLSVLHNASDAPRRRASPPWFSR